MGTGFSSGLQLGADQAAGPSGGAARPGIGDLPESCVALILSFLEPLEICRLGLLNRTFRQASSADTIWELKLPRNYKILINKLFIRSSSSNPHDHDQNDDDDDDHGIKAITTTLVKKDIYARLCCPIRFAGDTMEVWMDKSGGGLCVALSWKGLKITGISDHRYWNHISTDESRFQTIAYLKQIWWVEVEGNIELEFPAGTYSLYFRLQLGRRSSRRPGRRVCILDGVHGWDAKPVQFQLSSSTGHQATAQYYLNEAAAAGGAGQWIHYHVGDFVVDHNNDYESGASTPTKLKFSMTQIDCTHSKGGLCLDCVLVYPTNKKLPETKD